MLPALGPAVLRACAALPESPPFSIEMPLVEGVTEKPMAGDQTQNGEKPAEEEDPKPAEEEDPYNELCASAEPPGKRQRVSRGGAARGRGSGGQRSGRGARARANRLRKKAQKTEGMPPCGADGNSAGESDADEPSDVEPGEPAAPEEDSGSGPCLCEVCNLEVVVWEGRRGGPLPSSKTPPRAWEAQGPSRPWPKRARVVHSLVV